MDEELKRSRKEIDKIDEKVIPLLEMRFRIAEDLGKHKRSLTDRDREEEILSKTSSEHVKEVYKAIFKNSKKAMRRL